MTKSLTVSITLSLLMLLYANNSTAVEALSEAELAAHCKEYPENNLSLDGEFCARYIQGFIDGAVATDARVMLNVEADRQNQNSFTERALRTRLPNRAEYQRAARYAEFCLGDPVPLKEVVMHIVNDLNTAPATSGLARDRVYTSLQQHYPCSPSK